MTAARRAWLTAAVGAALLIVAVAFFVVTDWEQTQLLHRGVRTTAIVVEESGPSAWPPLNDGSVVVRYDTTSGQFQRRIWMDDWANRPKGSTWTVVYDPKDPGSVRSLTDANDPYEWEPPFLIGGLLGLALVATSIWLGLRVRRRKREAVRWSGAHSAIPQAVGPDTVQIPLRRSPLSVWTSYLAVNGDQVRLHLPGIFKNADLVVPRSGVWVVDEASDLDDPGENWVFESPVSIPYARTTATTLAGPNLTLLFTDPVAIPPMRYFGAQRMSMSRRGARSVGGSSVDGVSMRIADPKSAVAALSAAGLPRTTRPDSWLRDHRRITYDLEQVAEVKASQRRWRVIGGVVFVAAIGLQSVRFLPPHLFWLAMVILGTGLVVLLGLPWWVGRQERRRSRQRNETLR